MRTTVLNYAYFWNNFNLIYAETINRPRMRTTVQGDFNNLAKVDNNSSSLSI